MLRTLLYAIGAILSLSLATRGRGTMPPAKKVAADALALYRGETRKTGSTVLSPAKATRILADRYGLPTGDLASPVARVYYRENGLRNPLGTPTDSDAALAKKVSKRRDAPTPNAEGTATLGRWDTVAASLSAGTGRPYSARTAKGLSDTPDYLGRGTLAGYRAKGGK